MSPTTCQWCCAAVPSWGPGDKRGDVERADLSLNRQQQRSRAALHTGRPQDGSVSPEGQDCRLQHPGTYLPFVAKHSAGASAKF